MELLKNFDKKTKIIVIDPSGTHLAYAVIVLDKEAGVGIIEHTGMLWTKDSWTKGKRFSYMFKAIKSLIKEADPDAVYTESFFANPKAMSGSFVIPIVNGLIEMACWESNKNIQFEFVSPTKWRKILGIKSIKTKDKRDWKEPTKRMVEFLLDKLPDTIISNITEKERQLPTDIPDVLAISLAIGWEHGIKIIDFNEDFCYNNKYRQHFNAIAKEIK
jgi:Holliday junction resolvasome RuvABC endonuclease subunit